MKIEYTVCDHCGASVSAHTGAVVSRYTLRKAYETMHLCEACCDKLLTSPHKPYEKEVDELEIEKGDAE